MLNLVYLIWLCHIVVVADSKTISTSTGPLKGRVIYDDLFNIYYEAYEGIPYAEPPIGDLRFQAPVPKKPWTGLFKAIKPGCVCPQKEMIHPYEIMSEDCLFLNIFIPANRSSELLPVVIYVHPGDFKVGSGNPDILYGPQLIVGKDNILVTLNYRLGVLGFLSLQIEGASGNAGVKDVLLASKWVQKNIKQFGGNPNRITIMGHSTGAAIAHVLLLTEQSDGIFQQAILLGGSVTSPKFFKRTVLDVSLQLCLELGLKTSSTSPNNLLKQLKKIDAASLVKAQQKIYQNDPEEGFSVYAPFSITLENETTTAIITKEPLQLIKEGMKQNIPIIVGFNDQEGLEIFPVLRKNSTEFVSKLNKNFDFAIPCDIQYPEGSKMRKDLAASIKKFYFGDQDVSVATVQLYLNLVMDITYTYSIDSWIKVHKERVDSAPIYYYLFIVDGDLNLFKIAEKITYPGAAHLDDIGYTFVTKFTRPLFSNICIRSQRVINTRLKFLSNFIRYGNPTPCRCSNGFIWEEAGKNRNHIICNGEPTNIVGPPFQKRINFWYKAYAKYYQYLKTSKAIN